MTTTTTRIRPMSPRSRKHLDPRSKKFEVRFAIRLRELLDERGIGPSEFLDRLRGAGVNVSGEAVKKWLSGDALPRPRDMERIGMLLGLKDYRFILPPPV